MYTEDFLIFILLFIPVASLCLGLTLRFAIQPMVETLAQALRDSKALPKKEEADPQLLELREQMYALTEAVSDLTTEVEFDRQLIASESPE